MALLGDAEPAIALNIEPQQACQLERRHLQHHRKRLDYEDAAHDEEHDFLPHDDRDRPERRPKRQRAHVAHENLGRVCVEPEKCEPRAGDRTTEDRELPGAGNKRKSQVFGKHGVARNISKQSERAADHHGRHDREAVQAIGEIHGIARAHDHEIGHRDETKRAQRIANLLEKGHDEHGLRRQVGVQGQVRSRHQPHHRLPEKLGSRRKALGVTSHHLAKIVDPSDRPKTDRDP